jgi:Icc-related predicted phosphoesterase
MKILAVTDVHQMISKWKELVKKCNEFKPDVVAIAGDLFPKDTYITGQLTFMPHFKKYLTKIKDIGCEIAVCLGNDDNQLLVPEMIQGDKDGIWHYLSNSVINIKGYEFAGMPYVPDYPFGYKYWCRGESQENLRISKEQFCKPVVIDEVSNEFVTIDDYPKYLKEHKAIWESLQETASQVKDIKKSIWLIHAPPSNMELDVCADYRKVGSDSVYKFIKEYQPLITVHGHIHESPKYNGGIWQVKNGDTTCIQGGQLGFDLHYTMIDVEDGVVKKMKHSIYGS